MHSVFLSQAIKLPDLWEKVVHIFKEPFFFMELIKWEHFEGMIHEIVLFSCLHHLLYTSSLLGARFFALP